MNGRNDPKYKACQAILGEDTWSRLSAVWAGLQTTHPFSTMLRHADERIAPAFLADLALLEEFCSSVETNKGTIQIPLYKATINPTLQIIELRWKNLTQFLRLNNGENTVHPIQANERILIWYNPLIESVIARPATDEDLLVLKMVVEEISPESIAVQGCLPIGAVDSALFRAVANGLVFTPSSRIRRDPTVYLDDGSIPEQFLSTTSFTLQWHITQACDLFCKHCYDRSNRETIALDQAIGVLDDLRSFCKSRYVTGAVSFTGGNPLLHPSFVTIYKSAVERGFTAAILGNPAPREKLEKLVAIQKPAFFQVSLEGLQDHNDSIRGHGHFERVLVFLDLLKELNISSMVMLTLTSANIEQVIPLTEVLRGRTDVFHFNRLSMVGEGANLRLPDKQRFHSFLREYLDATFTNPVLGIKDNLINIILRDQGLAPFGGCTGFGCGAAFNFVTLLADGEVHACRKFPSPIGNIYQQTVAEIYDSNEAVRYRLGSTACKTCTIRPVCGGCLASTYSHKLNIFEDRDPFCFMYDRFK